MAFTPSEDSRLFPAATGLGDLFDPQVVGARINKKLFNAIKFAPLAVVNSDLVGVAGSTVTLPYYNGIGDAVVVPEGEDIPIKKLTEATVPVTIHKVGIGIQLTDESILSANGDPLQQGVDQMAKSIASKIDDDLLAALDTNATNVVNLTAAITADDVADALVKFGEDVDEPGVIVVDPATYAIFRKADNWLPASEISASAIMSGVVGQIYGLQVVVSNRIDKTIHIVRAGALALYLKRDTYIESDRDIVNKSTILTADKHYATYLLDPSKAIKINKKQQG